jgi:hypothetical protein
MSQRGWFLSERSINQLWMHLFKSLNWMGSHRVHIVAARSAHSVTSWQYRSKLANWMTWASTTWSAPSTASDAKTEAMDFKVCKAYTKFQSWAVHLCFQLSHLSSRGTLPLGICIKYMRQILRMILRYRGMLPLYLRAHSTVTVLE